MRTWTIKKRVIWGYAGTLALVAILGVCSYISLNKAAKKAKSVDSSAMPALNTVTGIRTIVGDNLVLVLRNLLAKDAAERKQIEGEISAMRERNAKLLEDYDKNATLPEDRELFSKLCAARDKYISSRNKVLELSRNDKAEEARALYASTMLPAYVEYQGVVSSLINYNLDNANKAIDETSKLTQRANIVTTSLVAATIALGLTLAVLMVIRLNAVLSKVARSLEDGAAQVAAAASQFSVTSQSLADGASTQAASIEETSASLEEMSSMTQRNSESSRAANDLAKQAREAADRGAGDMDRMNVAMAAIKSSSDDIAKIIKTIDEIAFQTNILALNAAVEAARAGDAGMGFAVVADEVRNLAQRSAQAAKETAAKIEDAILKSGQGVEISGKVAQALSDILKKARQVDDLVAGVAEGSREQSNGISQINNAVGNMDKIIQSNAASAEESAAAAEELNSHAVAMRESVQELLQLVGGDAALTRQPASTTAASAPHVKPVAKKASGGNGHLRAPEIQTRGAHGKNGHASRELHAASTADTLSF